MGKMAWPTDSHGRAGTIIAKEPGRQGEEYMFAIYNETGRTFRSTLEELYRVENVRAASRTRTPVERQPEERSVSYSTSEALKAYRTAIQAKQEEPIFHAYQVMKKPVTTVFAEQPAVECFQLMRDKRFRQLPVLSRQGLVAGMLTLEKILEKVVVEGGAIRQPFSALAGELMEQPVYTADPLSDIRRVAKLMYDRDVNCLPVTNEVDLLMGVVTRTDIVYAVSTLPGLALWA